MNSTVCKHVLDNRTLISREILYEMMKKVDNNTLKIQNNKMALNFGHNELEENHIHDVKPLTALPYYQVFSTNFLFKYEQGIDANQWRICFLWLLKIIM